MRRGFGVWVRNLHIADGRDLVAIEVSIAKGEPQYIPQQVRLPDGSYAELESDSPRVLIPDLGDRERARVRLMDRVYGKTPERVEHTDGEGQPLFDPRGLSTEALEAYALVLEAFASRARLVNGEVIDSDSKRGKMLEDGFTTKEMGKKTS